MKIKVYILILVVVLIASGLIVMFNLADSKTSENEKPIVAVSIAPQETFVNAVAGDLVTVVTMVPPGSSPTNYQPVPKQIISFSEAEIYFTIGVPTEESNIIPKIEESNIDIKVVALADIVSEVYPYLLLEDEHEEDEAEEDEDDHNHEGIDPHIWLSPKRVIIMINAIKDELILLDPSNSNVYEENAKKYIEELENTDLYIKSIYEGLENKSFIVYHPSFGYYADDYGLTVITVEEDGKSATAQRLQETIDFANNNNIKVVFYQAEFDDLQAQTIAKEINGSAIKVTPLATNYIENLIDLTETFANTFN